MATGSEQVTLLSYFHKYEELLYTGDPGRSGDRCGPQWDGGPLQGFGFRVSGLEFCRGTFERHPWKSTYVGCFFFKGESR